MTEKPFRVLIVEDNPGDIGLVNSYLNECVLPADITSTEDLAQTLDILTSSHFDVILLDLGLPHSSGLDTLTSVQEAAPDTAVIVLTGLDDEELAHSALRNGAEDYLLKDSVNCNTLERSLRYAIERQKAKLSLMRQQDLLKRYLDLSANIFLVINVDQTVDMINQSGCEILEYSEEEVLGKNWFDHFLPESDVDEVKAVFDKLVSGQAVPEEYYENPVKTRGGDLRQIAWNYNMLYDDAGRITGIVGSGIDVTDWRRSKEELTASEQRFRSLAHSSIDAIISADDRGHIVFWNDAAEKMFGFSRDEALNQHLTNIIPERLRGFFSDSFHKSTVERNASHIGPHMETFGRRKDGVEIPIELSVSSWQLEGRVYFTAIIRDISRRRATEKERRLANEESAFLNQLNDAANRGVGLDIIFRLVASEAKELFSSYGAMVYLLSDDRRYLILQKSMLPSKMYGVEKVIGFNPDSLDLRIDLSDEGLYYECLNARKPLITNDGDKIQELMSEFTESKAIRRMLPTLRRLLKIQSVLTVPLVYQDRPIGLLDVSSQHPSTEDDLKRLERLASHLSLIVGKRMVEDQLEEQRELLRQNNEELMVLYEVSTAIGRESSMKDLLRRAVEVISSISLFDIKRQAGIFLVNGDDMKLIASNGDAHADEFHELHRGMKVGDCLCGLAAETGEIVISDNSSTDGRHSFTYRGMQPHGHVIVPLKAQDRVAGVLYLYTPADAEVSKRMVNLLRNLGLQLGIAIEKARLYEETKSLSLHDPLTGVANRNLMNIELERSFAIARRYQRLFSVIMLDLDHFKNYNDTFGHTAGDNLLVDVARVVQEQVRDVDLVVRFGGEEFLLILPDTDIDTATEIAERIRKVVKNTGFFYSNEQPPNNVTVSLGVATYEEALETSDMLITRADNALYQAKFKGRNRVEISPMAGNNTVPNHN